MEKSIEEFATEKLIEIYQKNHPPMLQGIIALLKAGETPQKIYNYYVAIFGRRLTTDVIGTIAEYYHDQMKKGTFKA